MAASDPTLDEEPFSAFSRPPLSKGETCIIVYYAVSVMYAVCAVLMMVGVNLDQAEQRRRLARALVPQESVPCGVAEQYYLDERLLSLRNPRGHAERRQRMNFRTFAYRYGASFGEVLSRQHLLLSFFVRSLPMFTRAKRGLLIVLQLHICLLTASVAINVVEHNAPYGRYEVISCPSSTSYVRGGGCTETLPLAILSAALLCPLFRFAAYQQMRLTCFVSQTHPSSSVFPLNVRKFAQIRPKTTRESLLCMRNQYERLQAQALLTRNLVQRAIHALWRTTKPSIKDLRFYSVLASCVYLALVLSVIVATLAYVLLFTVYFQEEVVYHWLAWSLTMFFTSSFVFEPLMIFWIEVVWCALISNLAQYHALGASSLAATTKYQEVVRQVDEHFVQNLKQVGASRIQRWWLAVLDMYRAIHEQTAAAVKIQAVRRGMQNQKTYVKDRKWCLRVDVLSCSDIVQVVLQGIMSPLVRLQCEAGNPTVMSTKVSWEAGSHANFDESFFIDVKEVSAVYVSVWTCGLQGEEFVGRGFFELQQLKSLDGERPVNVVLYKIEHGEKPAKDAAVCGMVRLRVQFFDPLRDKCGTGDDDMSWMLPKHRMQFALSKMSGKAKVGQMLGGFPAPRLDAPGAPSGESASTSARAVPAEIHTGAADVETGGGPCSPSGLPGAVPGNEPGRAAASSASSAYVSPAPQAAAAGANSAPASGLQGMPPSGPPPGVSVAAAPSLTSNAPGTPSGTRQVTVPGAVPDDGRERGGA